MELALDPVLIQQPRELVNISGTVKSKAGAPVQVATRPWFPGPEKELACKEQRRFKTVSSWSLGATSLTQPAGVMASSAQNEICLAAESSALSQMYGIGSENSALMPDSGPLRSLPRQGGPAILEQPDGTTKLVLLAPPCQLSNQMAPAVEACSCMADSQQTYQALTVSPDDVCLQASIAHADAILQQRLGSRYTPNPQPVTTLLAATLPEESLAILPRQEFQPPSGSVSSGSRGLHQQGDEQQLASQGRSGGESDWLQRMRETDEALRAAIGRRDAGGGPQAHQT